MDVPGCSRPPTPDTRVPPDMRTGDNLSVVIDETIIHRIREAPNERATNPTIDCGKCCRICLDVREHCLHLCNELRAKTRCLPLVPVRSLRHVRFGKRTDEDARHLLLKAIENPRTDLGPLAASVGVLLEFR